MELNNWDLHAVVRGCCLPRPDTAAAVAADPFSSFPPPLQEEEEPVSGEGLCFPVLMVQAASSFYDLEELCKPFLQQQAHEEQQPQQQAPTGSFLTAVTDLGRAQQHQPRQPHRPLSEAHRSKRRKTQQKREVCQVPADGLSADVWAWRKYGQKPIKGSPYPRGYYRCSSSKGCMARKQVERSRTDPGMLIITYTAEHNHPAPTHRNSLAGSVRQKFPPLRSSSAADVAAAAGAPPPSSTPLSSSMGDGSHELLRRRKGREVDVEEELEEEEEEEEEELTVGDIEMVGEDDVLFLGLDEVEGSPMAVDAAKPTNAAAPVVSGFPREEGGGLAVAKRFFGSPWLATNSNATAAAGGS